MTPLPRNRYRAAAREDSELLHSMATDRIVADDGALSPQSPDGRLPQNKTAGLLAEPGGLFDLLASAN